VQRKRDDNTKTYTRDETTRENERGPTSENTSEERRGGKKIE
jgi:hypothetical protein